MTVLLVLLAFGLGALTGVNVAWKVALKVADAVPRPRPKEIEK